MIEEKKFDQRDVYANHVRIYRQIGRIYRSYMTYYSAKI